MASSKCYKSCSGTPADWPQWAIDDYEERAAILEYDGCLSRETAERVAREMVQKKVDRGRPDPAL